MVKIVRGVGFIPKTLPATRTLNVSPMPTSKMISTVARESMHPSMTAAGNWPAQWCAADPDNLEKPTFPSGTLVSLSQFIDDLNHTQTVALLLGNEALPADPSCANIESVRAAVHTPTPVARKRRRVDAQCA